MDPYEPTWESLDSHPIPEWFRDAKLGIFIHWGIYSVPGWAPTAVDFDAEGASPYAEWYPYYMYEEGSPTKAYHERTYGEDVEYFEFATEFTAEAWDPDAWAELFAAAGAGYVVLTGEHHDGFPLWESQYVKHDASTVGPERDLVGDLEAAIRERDLRFAASYHANYNYYQPGFEGRFGHPDFDPGGRHDEHGGPGPEYVAFMNAKHRELIRTYRPDLLWFDMPRAPADQVDARELIADYYNTAREWGKEVAVNDRAGTDTIGPTRSPEDGEMDYHGDFFTPEYASFDAIHDEPWETCRGLGRSFGYNRAETGDDHIDPTDLVHSFVDIVSKNGNLLLNVGPRADGTIPAQQRERLRALGEWLSVNGEAIFGTRPWAVAEDRGSDTPVRYTWRDGDLFAITLGWPGDRLDLSPPARNGLERPSAVTLLTADGERTLPVRDGASSLTILLPDRPPHDHAYTFRLSGMPNPRL